MKEKVYRAGVLPYFINSDNSVEFIFMKPADAKYGGPYFQIAKGKIEDYDESVEIAGIREGEEELGLRRGNILSINKLGVYLGRTTIYIAEIKDKNDFGDTCYETCDTAWMTEEQFTIVGRPLHIHIVRDAILRIQNI